MADQPQMPKPKGGVIAYLSVDGAVKASELYKKALGADVAFVNPPDDKGRTMHVHLYINGSSVMLSDFYPEQGHGKVAPAGFSLMLKVDDADAWFDRAVKGGMTAIMPVQNMFWGDRYGQLKDEFGVIWAINGPITTQ
ncbi:MAG TPA: glyoxalase/bleomycin resistance/extradiol dioxygenase family protein [Rhizomicrobium sp.]|nr:glyoxalase/bleomycin resistance/extradiol dioxygenase family protein [Rhizomicrobium sp.]